MFATDAINYYTEGKVLGPDGRPWQTSMGYEPGMNLPHVISFQGVIGSAWRNYQHGYHDDAVRNDPEFALAMRRDPQLMAMVQERKMATVSLAHHIAVDDEQNPVHAAMKNGLQAVVNRTWRRKQMFNYLLEATWFGRYGAQLEYQWENLFLDDPANPTQKKMTRCPVIVKHEPVYGDKIGYSWDGTPYIQIYAPRANDIPNAEITMATNSRGIKLTGTWRRKFIIHMHEALDADFRYGEQAGSIYGIGLRSTLYWLAWLKKELLANILTYVERTGLGLRVWYFQGGNPTSKAEVELAASQQTDRTNVIVPRFQNQQGRSSEGVEFVDSGSSSANLLLEILKEFDAEMERFVVGQSLSSGTEGSGLGGTGVASLHASTKHRLVAFDADNLGETLTHDWIRPLAGWMYGIHANTLNPRFVFDIDTPEPAAVLSAVSAAWSMGTEFPEEEVRRVTGIRAPQKGERTLSQMAQQKETMDMQAQSAMQQQEAAMQAQGQQEQPGSDEYNQLAQALLGG